MADEIPNQNIVTVTRDGDYWRAQLPDGLGISVLSHTPGTALLLLAYDVIAQGWQFDPSFQPRPENRLDDA